MIFETGKYLEKFREKEAYSCGGKIFSYGELYERAKEISSEILKSGAKTAAVLGNENFETMAAVIACVFSKCAYVPVDVFLPEERREIIIKSSGASLIIDCSAEKTKIIKIFDETNEEENKIAYIIFTSGSTGKPKGVPVSYDNLSNFIEWITKLEPLKNYENISVLNHASFGFDLSTAAIYYSLFCGHRLVQVRNTGDYKKLFSEIKKNKPAVIVATPTFLRLCLLDEHFSEKEYPFLKCIYFCGEVLKKSLAEAIFKRFPDMRMLNAYGPTEATSAVCAIEITKDVLEQEEILPVGKISSAAAEIITEKEEIVLKGKSVFGGYLGGVTGGHFFENGKNCYRTGDLGFIKNGKLYCKGRKDSQIKYKGYRIELSDIEANISEIGGIEDCAVVAKKNPEGEVRFIKAFVCGKITEEELRIELSKKLPEYMLPKTIKFLKEFPQSQNGKIDRKVLEKL
ncbi:MAG: D-alanine--poly(phosphoribitol) ligase [Ruminococcaceae bacterium]|nr:D-alanine--poly(phosphoribitol) ligase [Oscillospiraceae bacterium]